MSIETGRFTPPLPLALAVGRFFNVPTEEIFAADDTAPSSCSWPDC
jgi:DNA-binding XRE family transcriptional regulator